MKIAIISLVSMLLIATVIILAVSCSKSTEGDLVTEDDTEIEIPAVPQESSMRICFSTFPEVASSRSMVPSEDFNNAKEIISGWYEFTEYLIKAPRLAFAMALSLQPLRVADSTWKWTVNAEGDSITLTARRFARRMAYSDSTSSTGGNNRAQTETDSVTPQLIVVDSVIWDMYVTNDSLNNFHWFHGCTDLGLNGGWWHFYKPARSSSNSVLKLQWEVDESDTFMDFTMENIDPSHNNYGIILKYEVENMISTASLFETSAMSIMLYEIKWHIEEHWGKIIYYGGDEACWEGQYYHAIDCGELPWPRRTDD